MSLTFDQPMQDLAREIKKSIPIDYQLKSKQNDASLLLELVEVYESSESVVLNTLITELFSRAGKQWARLLGNIKKDSPIENISEELINDVNEPSSQSISNKQMYRGQTVSDAINEQSDQPVEKKKQYYRGSAV